MTDRKSVNMEKAGFQIALNDLLEKDIKVVEVVTDAHLGIGSVMKKDYPNIHHSHDIWHVAKNLGKKILKVAQKKGNNILLDWCKDIINHFWFSCRRAESYEEFMGIWRSVLHHITDTHEWILSHGGVNHCLHGELGEEERTKPWLSPTKHAHVLKDLAAVVLNKRLLNNVGYYLRFRIPSAHSDVLFKTTRLYPTSLSCQKQTCSTGSQYELRPSSAEKQRWKNKVPSCI
ncbi:uncharacterized protein LOC125667203 isoform X2 [Ostrea edulis]|uniref:uncharacterized protein LOC125667203 isoform X2 n=1 Tax=Ostrea edulis TaxID=37623 RepID=UPI0024AFA18F|nr:uncharacterized protein LOC125667203 isoform X2 [Ostrea edulis]